MSRQVKIQVNSKEHKLQFLDTWGSGWSPIEIEVIEPQKEAEFTLNSSDRGGLWFRVLDPDTDDEVGFCNMSVANSTLTANSAEGTIEDGIFISAGTQTYESSGDSFLVVFNVGEDNKASWNNPGGYTKGIACSQTNFKDARVHTVIENIPNSGKNYTYVLKFGASWGFLQSSTFWDIGDKDMPPANCKRTIFQTSSERSGISIKVLDSKGVNEKGFANLSFANSKLSNNSAEGSPAYSRKLTATFLSAGLKPYEPKGTPLVLNYSIGDLNQASWDSPSSYKNGFTPECEQTMFEDYRAIIDVHNKLNEELTFVKYWNDNPGGIANWCVMPDGDDSIPVNGSRRFVLRDNNRAAVWYKAGTTEYELKFTSPKLTSNSAEGSKNAGLQTYTDQKPAEFTYLVGTENKASWNNGNSPED